MTNYEIFNFDRPRGPEDERIAVGILPIPTECIDEIRLNDSFIAQADTNHEAITIDTLRSLLVASVPPNRTDTYIQTHKGNARIQPRKQLPIWYGPKQQLRATTIVTKGGFVCGDLYADFNRYSSLFNDDQYILGYDSTYDIEGDQMFTNAFLDWELNVNGFIGYALINAQQYINWQLNMWDDTTMVDHIQESADRLEMKERTIGISFRAHGTIPRVRTSWHFEDDSIHTRRINALEGLWVINQELQRQSEFAREIFELSKSSPHHISMITEQLLTGNIITPTDAITLLNMYTAYSVRQYHKLRTYQNHAPDKIRSYFGATQDTDTSMKNYDFDHSYTHPGDHPASTDYLVTKYIFQFASMSVQNLLSDLLYFQPPDVKYLPEIQNGDAVRTYISETFNIPFVRTS